MIEVRVNINCPDLVTAAGLMAKALGGSRPSRAQAPAPGPESPQIASQTPAVQTPTPVPQTPPAANVAPQAPPQNNVTPMPQPAPTQAPTTAPSYTAADVARAGAALIQANPVMGPRLALLLQQYGVKGAMDLPPEHLPEVANALRALGAKL